MLVEDAHFAGDLEECDNRKLLWLAMQTKAWKDAPILGKDAAILAEIECRLYPEYDGDKVKATEWGWDVCGGEVRYTLDHAAQEQPKAVPVLSGKKYASVREMVDDVMGPADAVAFKALMDSCCDEQEQPAPDGSAVDETLTREDIKQMSLEMVIQNFNNLRTRFELVEKERDQARARSGAQLRGVELLREERDDLRTKLADAERRVERLRGALELVMPFIEAYRRRNHGALLTSAILEANAALAETKEDASNE